MHDAVVNFVLLYPQQICNCIVSNCLRLVNLTIWLLLLYVYHARYNQVRRGNIQQAQLPCTISHDFFLIWFKQSCNHMHDLSSKAFGFSYMWSGLCLVGTFIPMKNNIVQVHIGCKCNYMTCSHLKGTKCSLKKMGNAS